MIDLHTHILPQIDDGSQSVQESLDMMRLLRQQGVTTVVATPHFYPTQETPESFLARRSAAVALLPDPVQLPVRLVLGAEVSYFSGIGTCDSLSGLKLGDSHYILVEMPFCDWSDRIIEDVCRISQFSGLQPVLAHVNRYSHRLQLPKHIDTLQKAGVQFQCNARAFVNPKQKRWAFKLLKSGKIAFLGTDCHNMDNRPPNMVDAQASIEKKLGAAFYTQFQEQATLLLNHL